MRLGAIAFVAVLLSGCADSAGTPADGGSNWAYKRIQIDGMTCFIIHRTAAGSVWSYDGVTCNWSEWNGSRK